MTIDPDVSRALAGCGCTGEQAGEALATGMRPALERLARLTPTQTHGDLIPMWRV